MARGAEKSGGEIGQAQAVLARFRQSLLGAATLLCLFLPVSSWAGMAAMNDAELSAVVAQGFSSFTMSTDSVSGNRVALADFTGISGSTYTEIDSMKMGYWDNTGGGSKGWDQNWTTVKLGTAANDLILNGFFFKAEFDPATINDPANRQLKSFTIGSKDVTGTVAANFQSFSGVLGGSDLSRAALGNSTYQFNHTELSFSLDLSGSRKGFWVNMGTATPI